ncbi:MAG: ankyrin repeat domain-containing protein [Actinomycetota bacterium]|nr:ankyrin repeat domain-containing protein [Actinomycetota bacterium]
MASTSDGFFEAIEAGDVRGADTLLDADPALANARDASDVSALMRALYRFDEALTETVKRRVDTLDIFEAAAFGDLDRLSELLNDEPSLVNSYSGDGFTALHFAAFFGRHEAAALLIERGAEVDAFGRGWMTGTAMHSAVSRLHADVVRILLNAGANPNVRQSAGWTPLHAAAMNGDLTSVELLLAAGADPTATNEEGRSVTDLANESGDEATADRIRSAVQAAP